MVDDDKRDVSNAEAKDRKATNSAGQDVGPPDERVDDEVSSDEGKKTKRQE